MTKANKKTVEVKEPATNDVQANANAAAAKLDSEMTTSAKIRTLRSQGFERGNIAKALGIRYQHVRNVLVTPLKGRTAKAE